MQNVFEITAPQRTSYDLVGIYVNGRLEWVGHPVCRERAVSSCYPIGVHSKITTPALFPEFPAKLVDYLTSELTRSKMEWTRQVFEHIPEHLTPDECDACIAVIAERAKERRASKWLIELAGIKKPQG